MPTVHPLRRTWRAMLLVALCSAPLGAQATRVTPDSLRAAVTRYRTTHEPEILRELAALLTIPNIASDSVNIRRNAAALVNMLERRGIAARLLESPAGGPPAVYGELRSPGAKRTIVLYAHYDGQPVEPAKWATPPWEPTLRDAPVERGGG